MEVRFETGFSLAVFSKTITVEFTEQGPRSAGAMSSTARNEGLVLRYGMCSAVSPYRWYISGVDVAAVMPKWETQRVLRPDFSRLVWQQCIVHWRCRILSLRHGAAHAAAKQSVHVFYVFEFLGLIDGVIKLLCPEQ